MDVYRGLRVCVLVEANCFYLFCCILSSEVPPHTHKYIRAVLWEAKFKVVYHTRCSFYQYCFRVRILDIV